MTRITIPKPRLFSFEECLWFLDRNYDDCLHHVSGNTISKVISIHNKQAAPYGDAGLLNALLHHKLIKDKSNLAGIEKLFKPFKGWESYLVLYFWRSLSVGASA